MEYQVALMFENLYNSSHNPNKELSNDHLNSCRKRIRINLYLWLKKSLSKLGIEGNFSTVAKFWRVSPKKEKKIYLQLSVDTLKAYAGW